MRLAGSDRRSSPAHRRGRPGGALWEYSACRASYHPKSRGTVRFPPRSPRALCRSMPPRMNRQGRDRFIPAGAGNTGHGRPGTVRHPVHPRRRGEHTRTATGTVRTDGSSPQALGNTKASPAGIVLPPVHPRRRGEHEIDPEDQELDFGSSPQARGTLRPPFRHADVSRFIPAGAGNTGARRRSSPARSVHPRRRGEHQRVIPCPCQTLGSSPQARGTLTDGLPVHVFDRFIPAGAGNTRGRGLARRLRAVHPRRRGEHNSSESLYHDFVGSSQQARGTRRCGAWDDSRWRFIPAGAGNTPVHGDTARTRPVHPRRRGEHNAMKAVYLEVIGSSPQARGTPGRHRLRGQRRRFHPRRRGEHGRCSG